VNDVLAFDLDDLDANHDLAHITFVCDEEINVSGDKSVSFELVQCIDDFGCFDGSVTLGWGGEGGMVGWDDGSEEGEFSDVLGDELECIAVDKEGFCVLIDFEIKNLWREKALVLHCQELDGRRHTMLDTFSAISSPESCLTSSVLHSLANILKSQRKRDTAEQ